MILHRISNPPVVQQGQATGSTRPQDHMVTRPQAWPVASVIKVLGEHTGGTRAGTSCLWHLNMGP